MRTREREIGLVVVESRRVPAGRVMASSAILAKIIGFVIGIISIAIVVFVARPAICRRIGIAGGMTLHTIQRDMRPG